MEQGMYGHNVEHVSHKGIVNGRKTQPVDVSRLYIRCIPDILPFVLAICRFPFILRQTEEGEEQQDNERGSVVRSVHHVMVHHTNHKDETAMCLACHKGHVEVAKVLLQAGADPLAP